ncbi:hypothetical protein Tco_0111193 [Tanacetum coccineum]
MHQIYSNKTSHTHKATEAKRGVLLVSTTPKMHQGEKVRVLNFGCFGAERFVYDKGHDAPFMHLCFFRPQLTVARILVGQLHHDCGCSHGGHFVPQITRFAVMAGKMNRFASMVGKMIIFAARGRIGKARCDEIESCNDSCGDRIKDAQERGSCSMRGDEAKEVCLENHLEQVPVVRDKADLTIYREGSEGRCDCASIDEVYLHLTDVAKIMFKEIPLESLESLDENVLKSLG